MSSSLPPQPAAIDYAQPLARKGVTIHASPGLLDMTVADFRTPRQNVLLITMLIVQGLLPLPFLSFVYRAAGLPWTLAVAAGVYLPLTILVLRPIALRMLRGAPPTLHVEVSVDALRLTQLLPKPLLLCDFPRREVISVYCDLIGLNEHKLTTRWGPNWSISERMGGGWAMGVKLRDGKTPMVRLGLSDETSRWVVKQVRDALAQVPPTSRPPPREPISPPNSPADAPLLRSADPPTLETAPLPYALRGSEGGATTTKSPGRLDVDLPVYTRAPLNPRLDYRFTLLFLVLAVFGLKLIPPTPFFHLGPVWLAALGVAWWVLSGRAIKNESDRRLARVSFRLKADQFVVEVDDPEHDLIVRCPCRDIVKAYADSDATLIRRLLLGPTKRWTVLLARKRGSPHSFPLKVNQDTARWLARELNVLLGRESDPPQAESEPVGLLRTERSASLPS